MLQYRTCCVMVMVLVLVNVLVTVIVMIKAMVMVLVNSNKKAAKIILNKPVYSLYFSSSYV